jgi:hypothetical protein
MTRTPALPRRGNTAQRGRMFELGKPTRRLRIFLRDFRMVEATVNLAVGQALTTYFASRRSYVSLRDARWAGTSQTVEHAALRVAQVLWAAAPGADVPLTNASITAPGREVELQLDGGLLVRGRLVIGQHQRTTDYLEAAGQFVPLLHALLLRSGRPPKQVNVTLGDIVLNQDAVQAVWEVSPDEPPLIAAADSSHDPAFSPASDFDGGADDAGTGYERMAP